MKTTQAIQLVKLPPDAKPIAPKHKFLKESLSAEVQFYKDEEQREYICFFGAIFFVLHETDNDQPKQLPKVLWGMKTESACVYYFYQALEDDVPKSISNLLRKSKTLNICDKNTFDSTSLKAVFAERGAWIWPKKMVAQRLSGIGCCICWHAFTICLRQWSSSKLLRLMIQKT